MYAASLSHTVHQISITDYGVTYERVNTYVGGNVYLFQYFVPIFSAINCSMLIPYYIGLQCSIFALGHMV